MDDYHDQSDLSN